MSIKLQIVLDSLMNKYKERVPDVSKIINGMVSNGLIKNPQEIENDHIAFRTMGVPNLGIASLEKIFLNLGYQKQNKFYFQAKKLDAFWYSPPQEKYPRIFISELRVSELSTKAQQIIHSYTDNVITDPVDTLDLNNPDACGEFLHSPLWKLPSWADYSALLTESEYASWVIYNRYYLNHFTISVHNLPAPYNDIFCFNEFLESLGVILNDSGNKVKISPDKGLLQSSSVANMIPATFSQGETHLISGSYVEFAERKILPEFQDIPLEDIRRIHRREGFEAGNADKIFESTYSSQTIKKK